jgi:hypothetical protein
MSYRNVFYDSKKSEIHHFSWTSEGIPCRFIKPYKPYILLQTASKTNSDGVGIDGSFLVKKEFNNNYERIKYVKTCPGTIYYNIPPAQQYLLDLYYNKDINELTNNTLKTFFFDKMHRYFFF